MSTKQAPIISEQEISDAYIYLLGRLLATRQQQLDFEEGFKWNEIVHRKPGEVDWPNPNLDVAYSEAWVAVDENSCTLVTVPQVTGRYYTVQFLNGWGETLANINERIFPDKPYGVFAVCLKGSNVKIPEGATRIDLPVKYSRVLMRVELGADWDGAVALQHKFDLKATGNPKVPQIPKTVMFDLEKFPGVEAFETGNLALDSEADINPGMQTLQANTRAISEAVKDRSERARIDKVIGEQTLPGFFKIMPALGHGSIKNGWNLAAHSGRYGDDWLTRTIVNYAGLWANTKDEVIYYGGIMDGEGKPLDTANVYTLTFPKDDLPAKYAKYFWSAIAVDSVYRRVLPNPLNRFLLNNQSKLEYKPDGSLEFYFAAKKPDGAPEGNWLPTPSSVKNYRITFRFYGPLGAVAAGTYYPPAIQKVS